MEKELSTWLETHYLNYQLKCGRISLSEWSKQLGVSKSLISQVMTGSRESMSMETAYQIGERLGDFTILRLLGYPMPTTPLDGFSELEESEILSWLEQTKLALDGVPSSERLEKLNKILSKVPEADNVSD